MLHSRPSGQGPAGDLQRREYETCYNRNPAKVGWPLFLGEISLAQRMANDLVSCGVEKQKPIGFPENRWIGSIMLETGDVASVPKAVRLGRELA